MSFWIGAGSILSLFTPYFDFNMSKDIDAKSIESDFGTIGGDIRNAIGIFEKSELTIVNSFDRAAAVCYNSGTKGS